MEVFGDLAVQLARIFFALSVLFPTLENSLIIFCSTASCDLDSELLVLNLRALLKQ